MQARAAIYLDANAGAPLNEAVRVALFSLLCETRAEVSDHAQSMTDSSVRDRFGQKALIPNPSSSHSEGRKAKAWLRRARTQAAQSMGEGVSPDDLTFVSSGTEAAQAAVRSVLEPLLLRGARPHWIFAAGDHEAHQQMAGWLEARGGQVSVLPLRPDGRPDGAALENLFRPETALVSATWVNNETGVITDVAELSRLCGARAIPLHLDAAQAWGKIPVPFAQGLASLVSFSGHKIGAPAGTGVLWRLGGGKKTAPVFPGKQESGLRGGTENLMGAVGLGAAASQLDPRAWSASLEVLRDRMEREILKAIPGAIVYGADASRVANTSFLGFEGVEKDGLVAALDLAGFCVSSGSACSSGITEPSRTLLAMGRSAAQARAAVRVSLHALNRWEELESFVGALKVAVEKAQR